MRIPQYCRLPGWQRFFSGVVIGAIIGFAFFITIYGLAQERQIDKTKEQKTIINELVRDNQTLKEDNEKENEKLEKQLKVQEIQVDITSEKYHLDRIVAFDLQQAITAHLQSLINKNIDSIADNRELIFRVIEGYPYTLEDKVYYFKIKSLVIFSVVEVSVTLTNINSG